MPSQDLNAEPTANRKSPRGPPNLFSRPDAPQRRHTQFFHRLLRRNKSLGNDAENTFDVSNTQNDIEPHNNYISHTLFDPRLPTQIEPEFTYPVIRENRMSPRTDQDYRHAVRVMKAGFSDRGTNETPEYYHYLAEAIVGSRYKAMAQVSLDVGAHIYERELRFGCSCRGRETDDQQAGSSNEPGSKVEHGPICFKTRTDNGVFLDTGFLVPGMVFGASEAPSSTENNVNNLSHRGGGDGGGAAPEAAEETN